VKATSLYPLKQPCQELMLNYINDSNYS
jgi:hypothetical protein